MESVVRDVVLLTLTVTLALRDLENTNIPVIMSSRFAIKGGFGHEDIGFDSEWSDSFNC